MRGRGDKRIFNVRRGREQVLAGESWKWKLSSDVFVFSCDHVSLGTGDISAKSPGEPSDLPL